MFSCKRFFSSSKDHSYTVPSYPAETILRSSSLQHNDLTIPECPRNVNNTWKLYDESTKMEVTDTAANLSPALLNLTNLQLLICQLQFSCNALTVISNNMSL